ncbi:MAG: protein translocase subunit SecD, partial [Pseudomonadota bacterium]
EREQMGEALDRLRRINPTVAGAIGGQRTFQIDRVSDTRIEISVSPAAREALAKDAQRKTMEIVRRRIDPDGVTEIAVTPQGVDRIVLEAPGEPDPTRLKDILSQGGRMTFNLVDDSPSAIAAAQRGVAKPGFRLVSGDGETLLIENTPIVTGADVASASQGYDEGNRPQINFRLNGAGAQRFGRASAANIGERFAIVLDDRIISAPVIQSAIMGGSGRITGNFSLEEAQDLSAIIEAGELPAKLEFIEERTVGAGLGEDSIRAGTTASIIGLALVAVFMILAYGLIGGFAVTSLSANIMLILGALSGMGATLTLPGIAGIILTIGMAVDANVLVFERIREERAAGRSPATAISVGYEKALSTILDANITTFIAAAILYMLGSGPVKGFAVTLAIGILTSVFTAFVVTRWFTATWMRAAKPKKLPI